MTSSFLSPDNFIQYIDEVRTEKSDAYHHLSVIFTEKSDAYHHLSVIFTEKHDTYHHLSVIFTKKHDTYHHLSVIFTEKHDTYHHLLVIFTEKHDAYHRKRWLCLFLRVVAVRLCEVVVFVDYVFDHFEFRLVQFRFGDCGVGQHDNEFVVDEVVQLFFEV